MNKNIFDNLTLEIVDLLEEMYATSRRDELSYEDYIKLCAVLKILSQEQDPSNDL
jgi:hypothetical protein